MGNEKTTTSTSVGAEAQVEFYKGFEIDEERLRRLVSIIEESRNTTSQLTITYEVSRSDGSRYETCDVSDVVAEENFASERITKLAISASSDDFNATLALRGGDAIWDVRGTDRNQVQVLNSRVRGFLRDDVCFHRLPKDPLLTWMPQAMAVLMVATLLCTLLGLAAAKTPVQEALESDDLAVKLNVLLERRAGSSMFVATLACLASGMLYVLGVILGLDRWIMYLCPRSEFLFGRERDRFAKVVALRGRLGWGIGIAFCVSLAAGLLAWFITR